MSSPDNPFATPPGGQQPPTGPPPYGSQPGYGSSPSYGPPPSGQAPPPYGPPYGAPQPGGWSGAPQTETKAMIALGLAIAAYTPTIPFIGAIAAIVLARMARRDILASGGAKTGLSMCTWATVLSVVHLVFCALIALLLLGLFLGLFLLPFGFS